MPKRPFRRDPPNIVVQNKLAGQTIRRAIYGSPDLASDSSKQEMAWGFIAGNFVSRMNLFTWDELHEAVRRYVAERGPQRYEDEVRDYGVLKEFRAHLWARVKAENRVAKANERQKAAKETGVVPRGTVITAIKAAQFAGSRAAT